MEILLCIFLGIMSIASLILVGVLFWAVHQGLKYSGEEIEYYRTVPENDSESDCDLVTFGIAALFLFG